MTTTDDRPAFDDIEQETATLDRLRELRKARDAAHAALQDAIKEQHDAGMFYEVINSATNACPAWCETCQTDAIDGSVGHHSALLPLAGAYVPEGETPVAWLAAFATHRPGELLPEPTYSIHSNVTDYELSADGVRLFAAVLLRQLERITGPSEDVSPAVLAATLRCYQVPAADGPQNG